MAENIRGERLLPAAFHRLGLLRQVIETEAGGGARAAADVWTGSISVAKRLESGELTRATIDHALAQENLIRYYVKANLEARTRCIDGRCICNYNEDPSLKDRPLGPQVPGGDPTAALCRRVADIEPLESDRDGTTADDAITADSFLSDIEDMQKLLDMVHWKAGGHRDDHATQGKTGCGAVDRLPEILGRLTSAPAQAQLRGLTKLMLGDNYNEPTVDELLGRFLHLQGKADTYFARDGHGNFRYLQEAMARIEQSGGVAKLTGQHNEVALVVNLVEGTTFHRDQFVTDNDGKLQVFNYDFWRSVQLAELLPRLSGAHRKSKGPHTQDDVALRNRFITSRALFGVATAMVLTDGSLELIVRTAK